MNSLYLVKVGEIAQLLTLILIFVGVLALTYFTSRFIGNYQSKTMGRGNIEIIEIRRLTSNKSVEIVRIANEYYAIAVGKDEINVIGKIEKDGINMPEIKTSSVPGDSFKRIFAKIKSNKKND